MASECVEVEAAKLLYKLIQESKDEPTKLAMKLYVICQHMRSSGKEQSLPYQVISRAMETVVSQHGLDINVLRSFRIQFPGGPQRGGSANVRLKDKETSDSQLPSGATGMPYQGLQGSSWHPASSSQSKESSYAGSFQNYGMQNDSNATSDAMDMTRHDLISTKRPPMVLSRRDRMDADVHQGSMSQKSSKSCEPESPASIPVEDTVSANSQERPDAANSDKQTNKKVSKKVATKRKRTDSKAVADIHSDYPLQLDTLDNGVNSRKARQMNKAGTQGQFVIKSSGHVQGNSASGQLEHLSSLSGSLGPLARANKEAVQVSERTMDKTKISKSFSVTPLSKLPEEGEVSSSNSFFGMQKRGLPPPRSNIFPSTCVSNQKVSSPSENTQDSIPGHIYPSMGINNEATYPANEAKRSTQEFGIDRSQPFSLPAIHSQGTGKVNVGTSGAFSSFAMTKMGFSAKAPADSENRNCSITRDGMISFPEKALENRSETSTTHMSPGKTILQERGALYTGHAYSTPQGSGIQEQQSTDNCLVKAEVVRQMNKELFAKPKSDVRLFGELNNNTGMSTLRNAAPKDIGTGCIPQASASSNMPFKEQHLKQLRAQCLVFLAFKSNLVPRKLHLEIALGGSYPKEEEIRKELNNSRGDASIKEPANSHESSSMFGRPNEMIRTPLASSPTGSIVEADSSSKDTEKTKDKKLSVSDRSMMSEGIKRLPICKQEAAESHAGEVVQHETDPRQLVCEQEGAEYTNQQGARISHDLSVLSVNKHAKPLESLMTLNRVSDGHSTELHATSMMQREQKVESVGTFPNRSQNIGGSGDVGKLGKLDSLVLEANTNEDNHQSSSLVKEKNSWNIEVESFKHVMNPSKDVNLPFTQVALKEKLSAGVVNSNLTDACAGSNESNDRVSIVQKNNIQNLRDPDGLKTLIAYNGLRHANVSEKSAEQEDEDISTLDVIPVSPPKYTMLEKWIMDQQKRKLAEERKWVLKQKKAEERIKTRFSKLKENVNSSKDIFAKTRSVIELKKLQLLQLQNHLRSDFLNDFFKPITSDMERLKSIKKHRQRRRMKQLEKIEQKMKEERRRRIRERQKEFFGEIEVNREKLEDCFKVKRERWKGFNKYVKEFHKRKERIHREKIDKIQKEKINLLKNNDLEGYLRMVQDAKSDRVKQLLKETEKYLQKLGSKLQEAKSMSRCLEMEMDDGRAYNVVETSEFANENADESDQAEHYLESNEKYYIMAHSVRESINEQPTSLQGGKLREYQMNGLRWLVSLYNNHLNGILADEMGLGKTVQVIALICYLMETKNDMGPFLVVVPSSVLPGWETEIGFWAPGINRISYSGPLEERRWLFKERIVHQKFNVLLTTYEYLMNRHDRPKLSKIHWHYIIIDEGHRIKNASCKLNVDLKHYQSSHRLLLTGTPLQNNLEELWALLNFLLPNIFNSSEDFSQWFSKPFEGSVDNSADEALLSEEENLLIINRLHQVLRPFVLRRLKHKVESELPEKIERLVRCEASAYQKLLMKRVEENLGSIGNSKGRTVHNTVMELRNICNHPYISQLHVEEVDNLIPKHYLPPVVRLCGKLEMLDRLLPKLKATDHRILFFATMTRLLDVMEEYLSWKHYRYLRLDGNTSGGERGALIQQFNRSGSEFFIFLLSIRAGGVGINLQAADTVIIFDTDWNPQVDLQAQARAHRIGQKKDVLILRLETVRTVEEQVRAAAEHKLGVANQSITAGFFDNNTSAEDRREYLESLRECKKEEASSVLDDYALNDLLARSESEIDVFEAVDKQRHGEEMAAWKQLVQGDSVVVSEPLSMPSRIVTEDDLKPFYQAMKIYETPNVGVKRKGDYFGGLDAQQYGRGKRAREVRSYEDQWTEEEFEKLCQVDSPESPQGPQPTGMSYSGSPRISNPEMQLPKDISVQSKAPVTPCKEAQPPEKRGRGRPKRVVVDNSQPSVVPVPFNVVSTIASPDSVRSEEPSGAAECDVAETSAPLPSLVAAIPLQVKGWKAQKAHNGGTPRGCGRKHKSLSSTAIMEANATGLPKVTGEASNKSEVSLAPDGMNVNRNSEIPSSCTVGDGVSKITGFLNGNQKPTAKQNDTSLSNTETALPKFDAKSSEKKNPADKKVDASFCSTQISLPSINTQPFEMKKSGDNVDDSFSQSDLTAVSRHDAIKVRPLSSTGGDKTTFHGTLSLKSVEVIKCQDNVNLDKARDLTHENIKNETLLAGASGQRQCPPSKECSTVASVVRRGSESKASVTRKKAAAREPRNRSNSTTAACERRARLAALKLAEEKKVDRKGKTVQAVTINDKTETDCIRPVSVTCGMICTLEGNTEIQAHTTPFHMGNSIEKSDFSNQPHRKLDLSTAEETITIKSCEDLAVAKLEENKTTVVDRLSKNVPMIEPSPLHLDELQPNAIQLSRTNMEVVVDDAPLRKVALPGSCSSENKNSNCLPCRIETPIDTIEKHHSLVHRTGPFSGAESSPICTTFEKPTGTPALIQSCGGNMHQSCEKNIELNIITTKAEVLEVGRAGELNSKELFCLHGSDLALSAGVEINEQEVEGGECPPHNNSDALEAVKGSRLSSEKDLNKEGCIAPSSFELVNLHENAVSVTDGKEVVNYSCPDNPKIFADGDYSCKKVDDSECLSNLVSVSIEVIKDTRESKGEILSVVDCSDFPGFDVNSTTRDNIALSTSEERKPSGPTLIDNPTLKIDVVPSLTADMIEDISQSDNLSAVMPKADTGGNITQSLTKFFVGSALNSPRETVNLSSASLIEDVSHGVSTALDPSFAAAIETNTPEKEVEDSKVTVVLSAEVSISEHTRNSSAAIVEALDKFGNRNSDIDTASGAKVIGHSMLNCQTSASLPRASVRATECAGEDQEELHAIDELAETGNAGTVKVSDNSLSCQELATSAPDQSICGVTDVHLRKELPCQTDVNPDGIKGKDSACIDSGVGRELSVSTSFVIDSGLPVQSSSNIEETEPVRTLDIVVSAPEHTQTVSVCNSEPFLEASDKPLIVEVSNVDNVEVKETSLT